MELALQLISSDETVKNYTIQELKDFNSQSVATQAKKREQLVFMMPSIKRALDIMGDDYIVELSTKNENLRNKIGSYHQKMVRRIKSKPIEMKKKDDEKTAAIIMTRIKINFWTVSLNRIMAYLDYDDLWGSELYNNVSSKDRLQDLNINQWILEAYEIYT